MDYKEMWEILKMSLKVAVKSDEDCGSTPHYRNVISLMEFNEEMQKEDE